MCWEITNGLCDRGQSLVNFLEMHWCDFHGNLWITLPFALLILFLIFKYISITVEEYIADAIARVTEFLDMSDSVAGVTLLAFANGAADMMTVLIASESEGGISYNIGSLYGGGLFVCAAVVPFCILNTPKRLKLNKMIINRLVVFYLFAALITISFAIYKYITWWGSCILLVLYLLLVIVVTLDDRKTQLYPNASTIMPLSYAYSEKDNTDEDVNESDHGPKLKKLHEKVIDLQNYEDSRPNKSISRKSSVGHAARFSHEVKVGERFVTYFEPRSVTEEYRVKLEFARDKRKIPVEELTFIEAFIHLIETPFLAILYLTVLPCDKEQYSKVRCLMYPFPGMLLSTWVIYQEFSFRVLMIGLSLGFILTILFVLLLEEERPPRWFILVNLGGLLGGLMWTYLLVGALIDLMECMGILLNLNKTFMGLTFLAVGSSIPDAMTTITLCKQSESIMAISGAYAGQLFALTVAFGISMLKLTLQDGRQLFDLFDPDTWKDRIMSILVIFTNIIVLVYTFIYCRRHNFTMGRDFAYVLMAIYVLFILAATCIGIESAIRTF